MNGRLVASSAAISAGLIALALFLAGSGQSGWETAARWTARHSFVWFLAAFAAPAFARAATGTGLADVFRHRRGLGLSFAAAHFIHLCAVLEALALGVQRPVFVFVIGGAGYALLAAMALTSNDVSQRALGPWWKRLHRVGVWTLYAIFVLNYAGRLARPESRLVGLWGMAMLLGLTLFKYWPRALRGDPQRHEEERISLAADRRADSRRRGAERGQSSALS